MNNDERDAREMREMLRAMQAGELTVSRGVELLDMWLAGNYSDDQLPPVRQDLIEEDAMPVEIIDRLRGERDAWASFATHLMGFVEHAPVSSGICCCGDDMTRHANPMDCGHTPVDQWDNAVCGFVQEFEALQKAQP